MHLLRLSIIGQASGARRAANLMHFCTATNASVRSKHKRPCLCCAASRDVAQTVVGGASAMCGLGTVPYGPRAGR